MRKSEWETLTRPIPIRHRLRFGLLIINFWFCRVLDRVLDKEHYYTLHTLTCVHIFTLMIDTQIYDFCSPADTYRTTVCISDVDKWMASNRLQLGLNATKTEVLWCASNRQQHLVPTDPFSVCGDIL